ncbi:MAG: acyl-CoA synthetase [Candidatus Binatia bacterium]|nr:MAG: acyl-CoA synthetase [Candidatus Binatia bacterium]
MNYDALYSGFRWTPPVHFNFTEDVVGHWARDRGRLALFWVSETGEERRFTYWDVYRQSCRFARTLQGLGVAPGDPVMVVLGKRPEWFFAVLGALRAGALVIPCTASLRAKDIRYRAQHSGARVIVTEPDCLEPVEAVRRECDTLQHFVLAGGTAAEWHSWDDLLLGAQATGHLPTTRADAPALCFYTSGTTKDPKAVLHAHAYTWAHRYTGLYWLDLAPGDLHWTTADTGWAKAAYGVLFGPWSTGATVFQYGGRFDPQRELQLLQDYEITVFCAPPTEYRLLVKENLHHYRFPRLRHCTGAGEPLNPEVIAVWREHVGPTIHDGYGQTETTLLVANLPGMEIRPGSMGKPFPGHEVRVIDDAGRELSPGEVGDVALRGRTPSLFREYWKNPEESQACWRGPWYVTGDRARIDEDGYFWFVGRADDVIISAGYRIGPFEVESALLEHPAVLESAVVASPHPERGSIVKAFVRLRPGIEPSGELVRELQEHVKRTTAPYKYPREIEFVEDLPKTVSGKIRRVELRQRELERKRTQGSAP